MFENLSERLERSFKILKGEGKITELNVAATMKDVRKALMEADVSYNVAKKFTNDVKEKALGMNVLTAVKPGQMLVKLVHDEMAVLMGGEAVDINLSSKPSIILMSGLQGSGKTTFSGKLANMLKTKRRKNPLLVACDVYRPAAINQLQVVGEQVGVPVYTEEGNKDVVEIANHAIREAKAKLRCHHHRHRRPSCHRRGHDAGDRKAQESRHPRRDPLCGGLHDRSRCGEHSQDLQRPPRLRWCGAHQARW